MAQMVVVVGSYVGLSIGMVVMQRASGGMLSAENIWFHHDVLSVIDAFFYNTTSMCEALTIPSDRSWKALTMKANNENWFEFEAGR